MALGCCDSLAGYICILCCSGISILYQASMHIYLHVWLSSCCLPVVRVCVHLSGDLQILREEQDQMHWYHHRNQARLLPEKTLEVTLQHLLRAAMHALLV